jgi:hypothetical protein
MHSMNVDEDFCSKSETEETEKTKVSRILEKNSIPIKNQLSSYKDSSESFKLTINGKKSSLKNAKRQQSTDSNNLYIPY